METYSWLKSLRCRRGKFNRHWLKISCGEMATFLFVAILLSATDKLWADQVCCEGLGFYNDSTPFNGMPLPQCPEDMDMVMKVYTRQNTISGQNITRNTIPPAFKWEVMSIFVVHGWMDSEQSIWMQSMKDTFLAQGDYNVIIVGWKGGAQNPYYPQSASNTRTVGGEIALVANNTINKGNSSKALMHCVGLSLGAHVCGHAGQQKQFGRISGLDPAGPWFEDRDWSVGLNPFCADLVDVIHTDGRTLTTFGFGMLKRLGHIDFYPNGGTKQPGCTFNGSLSLGDIFTSQTNIMANVYSSVTCSHERSLLYFNESILSPCFRSRYSCEDQESLPESCTESSDTVQSMGFNATAYPGRGIFYLTTNSVPPFCRG